ncbi:hypothetical protein AAFF_G00315000 [Aldrovandia affinis]|uniref:Transmembrane channel-like protein n=1 Tax=Aldrovandia affinis TaxID=143900 RepID=A0AAD7R7E9_9TELE|nr:hypothetical protein AAFF_G00315000 [Aldrovandia affinis]
MEDMSTRSDGHFMRLISDHSSSSNLPGDQQSTQNQQLGPPRCQQDEWPPKGPARNWDPTLPLKRLPLSMQEKRNTREQRQLQRLSIGCWESWRRSQCILRRRLREQVARTIGGLQPWRNTLHVVEGKFGAGVKAYFTFLRYLFYLNLMHGLFMGGLALLPALLYGSSNQTQGFTGSGSGQVLDLFLGTGVLEHSPVFYGFYLPIPLDGPCMNSPLLFLTGVSSLLTLSFIMVVRSDWLQAQVDAGDRYNVHMSYKVFCSWDFHLQDPESAILERSVIRNDLKLVLEEERHQQRVSLRTLRQWLQLYFLRGILNFLVVTLLVGSFCLVHYATVISQHKRPDPWVFSLLIEYLPPITMTAVNFLLPDLFRYISRSIFLKLGCLGIFLLFLPKPPLGR